MRDNLKAIACEISRGGFSDERIFTFSIRDTEYSGVASRRHLWKADFSPLEEGEPPLDSVISGYVAARVLELRKDDSALVTVPDGEVVEVPFSQLEDRNVRVGQNVSV